MNNFIRLVVVELAWLLLEEAGVIIAGVSFLLEFVLHQREKHLKLKAAQMASQRLQEHAVVEAAKFHARDDPG